MTKIDVPTPRFGWALTGSGHYFKECIAIMARLPNLDVFVSKAASEVMRMYKQDMVLPEGTRIFKDTTASSAPVGNFYFGVYHTLILAPASSNTRARSMLARSSKRAFSSTMATTCLPSRAASTRDCTIALCSSAVFSRGARIKIGED